MYVYIMCVSRSFRILNPKMKPLIISVTNMWKGEPIGKKLSSKSKFRCFGFKSMYRVIFACSRTCGVRFVNHYDRHIIKKARISW